MEYPYFKGLEADRYSFYRVPKALVKADLFQKMSGDAKLLYAVLLDRMSLSIKNGWQDKHGNAYIICTIEEVMDSKPQTAPRCDPKCSCGLCGIFCYMVNGLQNQIPKPYKIAFSSFTIRVRISCSISLQSKSRR